MKIDLIVRGFCTLRPGVPGLSENIRVISVIGRFLEHSRIFYFRNGAADPVDGEFYIGSADWMYRNLHARVEADRPDRAAAAPRAAVGHPADHAERPAAGVGHEARRRLHAAHASTPDQLGSHQAMMSLARQQGLSRAEMLMPRARLVAASARAAANANPPSGDGI